MNGYTSISIWVTQTGFGGLLKERPMGVCVEMGRVRGKTRVSDFDEDKLYEILKGLIKILYF